MSVHSTIAGPHNHSGTKVEEVLSFASRSPPALGTVRLHLHLERRAPSLPSAEAKSGRNTTNEKSKKGRR